MTPQEIAVTEIMLDLWTHQRDAIKAIVEVHKEERNNQNKQHLEEVLHSLLGESAKLHDGISSFLENRRRRTKKLKLVHVE